jgi:putative thioredoxin
VSIPSNFGQAFDLGALKNPVPEDAIYGIPVDQKNLVEEFLPASTQLPVIIVCWSAKSKPSLEAMKGLGILFDEIAQLGPDAPWLLGNLNVDKEVAVVKALQIPSVPFAIALIGEQLVPLFETLPTPEQLRLVVDRVIALAAERGVGRSPAPDLEGEAEVTTQEPEEKLEPEEEQALAALEKSDYAAAKIAYEQWLTRSPGNTLATLGLAQVTLLARIEGVDQGVTISGANEDPADVGLAVTAADIEIAQGNYDGAFTRLINTVRVTSGDDRKTAREHLVMLFALVDPSDPGLAKARQQLASALF